MTLTQGAPLRGDSGAVEFHRVAVQTGPDASVNGYKG